MSSNTYDLTQMATTFVPVNKINSLSNMPSNSEFTCATGGFQMNPTISPDADANGYNGFPTAYEVYQANLVAATPTDENLVNIGSQTEFLPGPNNNMYQSVNMNQNNVPISLASQNANTFANGLGSPTISSSLLPNPAQQLGEPNGFQTCDTTNILANQVFLSPSGQLGVDTIAGSNRNTNQSIRSEPPNPVNYVGPWNLSSIYPDLTRRPLEGVGPAFGMYGTGVYSSGTPLNINN